VRKPKCVLYMLMREECHCNKYISTGLGLLTFCKPRHAVEAQRTNNITFREIGVKNIRVRKIQLHERPQDGASDSRKEQILLLNLSPLFCIVLQNGFLTLWKHCRKLGLCTSSRPSHLQEAFENRISNLIDRFPCSGKNLRKDSFICASLSSTITYLTSKVILSVWETSGGLSSKIETYVASFVSFKIRFSFLFQGVKLTAFVYSEKVCLHVLFRYLNIRKMFGHDSFVCGDYLHSFKKVTLAFWVKAFTMATKKMLLA